MRVTVNELMDRLGVGQVLKLCETYPLQCYDSDKGLTCNAEVRMSPSGDEVEAEVQMMYDTPPPGKGGMEQICTIRVAPIRDGLWTTTAFRLRGEPPGKDIYNWEEKSCNFFAAILQSLRMNEIPDIDALIEQELKSKERLAGSRGGGGGKSPKIRAGQLLDMKKGRGF